MKVPFVDLVTWLRPSREEYLAAFATLLDTGAFIGGPQVAEFETAFAGYTGAAHAVAVKTGTDALLLAMRALGVKPGDEVITAANSFFATAEAISHAGAVPVFADVVDDTLLIDLADLERRITKKTKCIIPVHLFGQIADMPPILALGLTVIEDSAQAHGSTRGGQRAGSIADAAGFSFYPTKNLGALGEGGAITLRDPQVAERVRSLRDHGQAARHDHVEIGYNARLDSLQCAGLSITLRRLDAANAARRKLAARYRQHLANVPGVKLVAEAPDSSPVYHLMIVRVDSSRRDAIRESLAKAGVATAIHYPTPIHLQRAYAHLGQGPGSCPVAERAAKEMISLPMFPDLTVEQVDHVAESLVASLRAV
ncbi:MAG: dTDP-3-amino-3,6-dideoxy-alpha-D-galactopyranose transaminase [Myxococcales bacterium]|nr:dTDP-3-amino-3,6-dideoxy-alpha-D-galactopyranose transaminase [Myxococcales bacterium]